MLNDEPKRRKNGGKEEDKKRKERWEQEEEGEEELEEEGLGRKGRKRRQTQAGKGIPVPSKIAPTLRGSRR